MEDNIDTRIGRNLRTIRMEAALTIDALASRTGLQPPMLTLYEAGRRHLPVEMLMQLATALRRPIADFFV